VVVEARERSGALMTADFALELGREVFAVPGEITSALSAGTNDLIRQGATPLLSAEDVLGALGLERAPSRVPDTLSAGARALLVPLSEAASTLDELGRLTGLGSAAMAAALTELELAGLVAAADGLYRSTTGGRTMA
jgi:DNA processing protein